MLNFKAEHFGKQQYFYIILPISGSEMDGFVSPRPKMDVSHEVNCKMNANAKCIFLNE